MLDVELNSTMQDIATKIQEGGLQLPQVILNMVKNSYKCGHDLNHYLLEDRSKNIAIEVESGHEKKDYHINQLF